MAQDKADQANPWDYFDSKSTYITLCHKRNCAVHIPRCRRTAVVGHMANQPMEIMLKVLFLDALLIRLSGLMHFRVVFKKQNQVLQCFKGIVSSYLPGA